MIPKIVYKSTVQYVWYKNNPTREVKAAYHQAVKRAGKNILRRQTLVKQEIIYLIEILGLPENFTPDEWYDYLDDPTIDNKVEEIKIDL